MKSAIALCLPTMMLFSSGCAAPPIVIEAAPANDCAWIRPLYLGAASEAALRAGLARARARGDADAIVAIRLDVKAIGDHTEAFACNCLPPARRPGHCPAMPSLP